MTAKKRRCKACHQLTDRLRDMSRFEDCLSMTIKASFTVLTGIEVGDSDGICRNCLKSLIRCGKFIEQCEQSEAKRLNVVKGRTDGDEIEERIEGEPNNNAENKAVTFNDDVEEVYESDFEDVTSEPPDETDRPESEGLEPKVELKDDLSDVVIDFKAVRQHFCVVCRRNFPSREAMEAHYKGSAIYCQTFIVSTT